MKALSPSGAEIIGTADTIQATAIVQADTFTRNDNGSLSFDYTGESDVDWNSQRPHERDGKPLFIDENGARWTADQITLIEESE